MSSIEILAVVTSAFGAVVTAIAGAIVLVMNNRHKNKTEAEKTAVDHWRELYELQQRHTKSQGDLIAELYSLDAECQVSLVQQYGTIEWLHDFCSRCATIMKSHGMEDPGPVPPLPPKPMRKTSTQRTEFLMRQSAQDSSNLTSVGQALKEKPSSGV